MLLRSTLPNAKLVIFRVSEQRIKAKFWNQKGAAPLLVYRRECSKSFLLFGLISWAAILLASIVNFNWFKEYYIRK